MTPRSATAAPHIPVLRFGAPYRSLDVAEAPDHRDGSALAVVSQANAGIIRRDMRRARVAADALRTLSCRELLEICARAGELFMTAELPVNDEGVTQSPDDYVAALSASSGLPHTLCRRNMQKVHTVFTEMPTILSGLTRGLDLDVIDTGTGVQAGGAVCYTAVTDALGVVLPSNSPGVNSIWMPAIALKVPVVLKPGREEPWTPLRIIQAFIGAGCPREAFGFYPTDHEGSATILECCGRSLLFGDEKTTGQYAANPAIQIHGPGRSKVLVAGDALEPGESLDEVLDVLLRSIADNGGRSCINASSVFVAARGDEIADALARRLAQIEPRPASDESAALAAFANPAIAEAIDAAIERGIAAGGAEDVTARYRSGPRREVVDGSTYLRPTILRCASVDHPLANTEFLYPFAAVVEMPRERMLDSIGPSLVVTAIGRDAGWIRACMESPHIDRLNIGPVPTSRVDWDQPHEGNLFELLYRRRAVQRRQGW